MASKSPKCIAVLYATKGGMGDVGKFAAVQACKMPGVVTRVIAMSAASKEGMDRGVDADVRDEKTRDQLKKELDNITVLQVDVESESAQKELEGALDGVDAVVACLGNRQPCYARWIATGAEKVVAAMAARNVSRLVQLSSFGIGDDFMPLSCIGMLWAIMLRTVINSARIDLTAMEKTVEGSELDYLLVRTVGIDPATAPEGRWKILASPKDGRVSFEISKADVGSFMLQEALNPTLHCSAITIGRDYDEAYSSKNKN